MVVEVAELLSYALSIIARGEVLPSTPGSSKDSDESMKKVTRKITSAVHLLQGGNKFFSYLHYEGSSLKRFVQII